MYPNKGYHKDYVHSTTHTQITQHRSGYKCMDCNKEFKTLKDTKEVECTRKLIHMSWLPKKKWEELNKDITQHVS